jgi:hypothetical protein
MKNTSLKESMPRYAYIAGSVLLASSKLSGQISYTDLSPDTVLSVPDEGSEILFIDFDDNAVNDMYIEQFDSYYSDKEFSFAGILRNTKLMDYDFKVKPLSLNDSISSTKNFNNKNTLESSNYEGFFGGEGDKYIGVRFEISDVEHYGWVLVNVTYGGDSVIVKGYAYEQTAGKGIKAGDKGTITSIEKLVDGFSIVLHPNPVKDKFNIQGESIISFVLTDLTGKVIKSGDVQKNQIDISEIEAGIYNVKLATSNGYLNKKLVKM